MYPSAFALSSLNTRHMYPVATASWEANKQLTNDMIVKPQKDPLAKNLKRVNTAEPSISMRVHLRLPIFIANQPKKTLEITSAIEVELKSMY